MTNSFLTIVKSVTSHKTLLLNPKSKEQNSVHFSAVPSLTNDHYLVPPTSSSERPRFVTPPWRCIRSWLYKKRNVLVGNSTHSTHSLPNTITILEHDIRTTKLRKRKCLPRSEQFFIFPPFLLFPMKSGLPRILTLVRWKTFCFGCSLSFHLSPVSSFQILYCPEPL